MTKADIAARIQQVANLGRKESAEYLEEAFSIMKSVLAAGEPLQIPGFGSFAVRHKKDRIGRNPQTGGPITIKARRILFFRPSPLLRQQLNKNLRNQSEPAHTASGKALPQDRHAPLHGQIPEQARQSV